MEIYTKTDEKYQLSSLYNDSFKRETKQYISERGHEPKAIFKQHLLAISNHYHFLQRGVGRTQCVLTFCDSSTRPLPGGSFALPCVRGRSLFLEIWRERGQKKRRSGVSVRNGTISPRSGASNLLNKDTGLSGAPGSTWVAALATHACTHTHTHTLNTEFHYVTIVFGEQQWGLGFFFWQQGLQGPPMGDGVVVLLGSRFLQGPLSVYVTCRQQ